MGTSTIHRPKPKAPSSSTITSPLRTNLLALLLLLTIALYILAAHFWRKIDLSKRQRRSKELERTLLLEEKRRVAGGGKASSSPAGGGTTSASSFSTGSSSGASDTVSSSVSSIKDGKVAGLKAEAAAATEGSPVKGASTAPSSPAGGGGSMGLKKRKKTKQGAQSQGVSPAPEQTPGPNILDVRLSPSRSTSFTNSSRASKSSTSDPSSPITTQTSLPSTSIFAPEPPIQSDPPVTSSSSTSATPDQAESTLGVLGIVTEVADGLAAVVEDTFEAVTNGKKKKGNKNRNRKASVSAVPSLHSSSASGSTPALDSTSSLTPTLTLPALETPSADTVAAPGPASSGPPSPPSPSPESIARQLQLGESLIKIQDLQSERQALLIESADHASSLAALQSSVESLTSSLESTKTSLDKAQKLVAESKAEAEKVKAEVDEERKAKEEEIAKRDEEARRGEGFRKEVEEVRGRTKVMRMEIDRWKEEGRKWEGWEREVRRRDSELQYQLHHLTVSHSSLLHHARNLEALIRDQNPSLLSKLALGTPNATTSPSFQPLPSLPMSMPTQTGTPTSSYPNPSLPSPSPSRSDSRGRQRMPSFNTKASYRGPNGGVGGGGGGPSSSFVVVAPPHGSPAMGGGLFQQRPMTPSHSSYSNQHHHHGGTGGNGTYFPTPRSPYHEATGLSLARGLNGHDHQRPASTTPSASSGGNKNGIVTRDVAQSVLKNPSGHGHGSSNGEMDSNHSGSSSFGGESSAVDSSADGKSNGGDENDDYEPAPITFASISSYDATNTPISHSTSSIASSSQRSLSPPAGSSIHPSNTPSSLAPPLHPSSPLTLPHQDTNGSPGSTHASLSSPSPAAAPPVPSPPPVSWADDDREMDSA